MKRVAARLAIALVSLLLLPRLASRAEANGWLAGDVALQQRFAAGVAAELGAEPGFDTGWARIDGEWAFAARQMAVLGWSQIALAHPETRDANRARVDAAMARLLTPGMQKFDRDAWGADPLEDLDSQRGHAGYLGYLNLSLSYERLVWPETPRAALNDRITAALVRRIEAAPTMLVETYPGELWPPDNTAVIGSIALYDRATGADHRELIRRWCERARRDFVDPKTGLLYQRLHPDGTPAAPGRGSGTALGVYFLSFLDDPISRDLESAVETRLDWSALGFGAVREYPRGVRGRGDVDSGPLVLGLSPSGTGFSIAGAKLWARDARFRRLYASAHLVGLPQDRGGRRRFVSGGPLGDGILLAMLTALPPDEVRRR